MTTVGRPYRAGVVSRWIEGQAGHRSTRRFENPNISAIAVMTMNSDPFSIRRHIDASIGPRCSEGFDKLAGAIHPCEHDFFVAPTGFVGQDTVIRNGECSGTVVATDVFDHRNRIARRG